MNALTVDEGLSQNMVVSMLTDSRGLSARSRTRGFQREQSSAKAPLYYRHIQEVLPSAHALSG